MQKGTRTHFMMMQQSNTNQNEQRFLHFLIFCVLLRAQVSLSSFGMLALLQRW